MKSNMTMLALARAKAYANEVQAIEISDGISVIGYATTIKDLAVLYKEQGFTSPNVARRHLQIWKDLGFVKTYYGDVIIVFVPLPTDYEQITTLTMEQRRCGSSTIAILPTPTEVSA